MCTAIWDNTYGKMLGRTLDVPRSYGECVVGVPRGFELGFLHTDKVTKHHFFMGVGIVRDGAPLLFDAVNECGLACAGLNFPESARYLPPRADKTNLASFEIIPYVLSRCESADEAMALLSHVNVTGDAFSDDLPPTPLHWIFADKKKCFVAEPVSDGLRIYKNPLGVLANEPPFPAQSAEYEEHAYTSSDCFSSRARFSRAAFANSRAGLLRGSDELSRFFAVADTVRVPFGCSSAPDGEPSYTAYTSCADLEKCAYYVREYSRFCLRRVRIDDFYADGGLVETIELCRASKVM